jgi:uncharacterized coiled-coil protein SlyX
MSILRRLLGILVMLAGILGLALSLAGLVGVWMLKPTIAASAATTINTLNESITTSQNAMQVTGDALAATVDSVDALSTMLGATAASVKDTQPVLTQVNTLLGEELPATMESATSSLRTAQQAAVVLDAAIKSLDTFRALLSAAPLVGGFVGQPGQAYNPQVPLADSLGDLATNLEGLPKTFTDMSASMDKADDNLATIESSLTTMSDSVRFISTSLGEYEKMVAQSQASMDNVKSMLTSVQSNLPNILNYGAIVLSLVFFWLLAAQVVIFSQGWELFQGTAGRMEGGEAEKPAGAEMPAAG